jgi:osmotically-inducible protein OsmY
MITRNILLAAIASVVLLTTTGCAVTHGQESVGAYIDDATITAQVKSRFIDSSEIGAASIHVETLNGTVLLSGFAKDSSERSSASRIARKVDGVKTVRNEITIRR